MKNLKTKTAWCLGALVVLFAVSSGMGQTIRLKDKATIPAGEDVRLGIIATISGVEGRAAERLAETIIAPKGEDKRTVKAENVLMAVISQYGPGGVANTLQIVGSASCEVTVGPADATSYAPKIQPIDARSDRAIAMAAVMSTEPVKAPVATPDANPASPKANTSAEKMGKLAQLLTDRMVQENGAREEDLRVSFETISPLLDVAAGANQKWQFRPLNHSSLGTVQYEAQLIEGAKVVQKLNVQMRVLRRADVLVAAGPISKSDVITKDLYRVEETWLDRKMQTLVAREADVLGMEATRPVAAGSPLDQRDFRGVEMAPRGEVISVIFLSGGLKVQSKGRAMETGRLHDQIKVRNESTNETYQATVIGKDLAVVGGNIDAATEKALCEGH